MCVCMRVCVRVCVCDKFLAQLQTIYFLPPVDCVVPHAPGNGIIENIQNISTVGGAQIFFRCSPGYVPAGRMNATCVSPDGISAVGTWTPDPADLVCNGEMQQL